MARSISWGCGAPARSAVVARFTAASIAARRRHVGRRSPAPRSPSASPGQVPAVHVRHVSAQVEEASAEQLVRLGIIDRPGRGSPRRGRSRARCAASRLPTRSRPGGRVDMTASSIATARTVSPAAARWRISATARRASARPSSSGVSRRLWALKLGGGTRGTPLPGPARRLFEFGRRRGIPLVHAGGEVPGALVRVGHRHRRGAGGGGGAWPVPCRPAPPRRGAGGNSALASVVEREESAFDGVGDLGGNGPVHAAWRRSGARPGRALPPSATIARIDGGDRRRAAPTTCR